MEGGLNQSQAQNRSACFQRAGYDRILPSVRMQVAHALFARVWQQDAAVTRTLEACATTSQSSQDVRRAAARRADRRSDAETVSAPATPPRSAETLARNRPDHPAAHRRGNPEK